MSKVGGNDDGSFGNKNLETAPQQRQAGLGAKRCRKSCQLGSAGTPASSCCVLPAALASHDYILKIVPTVYEDKSGKQRYSYQYTVANKVRSSWARLRATAPSAGQRQRRQVDERIPAGSLLGAFPAGLLRLWPASGQALSLGKAERPVSEARGGRLTRG